MATAPKDGTVVLLSYRGSVGGGRRAPWAGSGFYCTDNGIYVKPDRWQPLPAAWKSHGK